MTTITREITIPVDYRITVELPRDCPAGAAKITLIVESRVERPKNAIAALRGKGKGKVWMSDDFDAPLADFAKYM